MRTIKEALEDGSLSLEDEIDYDDTPQAEEIAWLKLEIERLNNIVNNIENDLLDRYYGRGKYHLSTDIVGIPTFLKRIKELKGSDK